MEEVLTRRLTAYLDERGPAGGERGRPFAYPPQLLLVDGGKGQLAVAVRVLKELGLDDEIPVAALAKRFEEVYLPGRAEPVMVPRGPRRCTSCSGSATRPTASPSPTTASCATSG
jgi:excinuclease ABC subunit C